MLTVITGPPCGGKTTHVRDHAEPGDVVLDLDAIAHAMGYPHEQITWGDDHAAVRAARMARGNVLHALLSGKLECTAWVIDTDPDGGMRAQYRRAGARIVTIDPGLDTCLERAVDRPAATRKSIADWYARHPATGSAALGIFGR